METYAKAASTKRFIVEDSITKVTSDGEPHELMTMVAGLSGLLAAIVILAIVVSMVTCRKKNNNKSLQQKQNSLKRTLSIAMDNREQRSDSPNSNNNNNNNGDETTTTTTTIIMPTATTATLTHLQGSRFAGNLNAAFIDSDLNLTDTLRGKKRQHNWQDAVAAEGQTRETYIQVERY